MSVKLFPTILIILDLCAAAFYAVNGDTRHCGYWISAASITFFATF
jgi:hypothetical protein